MPENSSIQIGFGHVWHKRLRPVINSFQYSVFFLRIPLHTLNISKKWPLFLSYNRSNLFALYDKDHGDGKTPLLTWIKTILQQHNVHDVDGEIILQTFPRMLGYIFNPISFWFCYQKNGDLRAILCEVNNTFGERHGYLLKCNHHAQNSFTSQKIFHVSPFCEVTGHYDFKFDETKEAAQIKHIGYQIDYADEQGPLLLTRISGQLKQFNKRTSLFAFFCYPLLNFKIIFAIHWQAFKLWFKRLPFHKKPPAPDHFISE